MASLHKLFINFQVTFQRAVDHLARRERDIRPQGSLRCSLCSGSWTALDSGPLPGASRCLAAPPGSALPAAHAPPTETAADAFLRVKRDKRRSDTERRDRHLWAGKSDAEAMKVCSHVHQVTLSSLWMYLLKIHQISRALTVNSNVSVSAGC